MLLEKAAETAYITPRGMARIETELARLIGDRRLEIVERLQDARTGGDGIDNTEYIAALEELAMLDIRIRELEDIMRHAELILPGEVDGIIHLGSTVVVQEEGANLETYTIVGPAEANPSEGMISNRCPLGRALLDHTIGDKVEVLTPDGRMHFRIIAVN
jgi:transcription elongation factor GreA